MAWNPSPQVAVARDAALKIGKADGVPVNRCVILYTRADGRIGYASYGKDRALCAEAKAMADVVYEKAMEYLQV